MLESLLLSFFFNSVSLSMSILLLYQFETTNVIFLVLLTILICFICIASLTIVIFVGEVLGVTDEDFIRIFRFLLLYFPNFLILYFLLFCQKSCKNSY